MSTDIARALLGRETTAIDALLGLTPLEILPLMDGRTLYKFDKSSSVNELYVCNGRIVRCGYTDERRATPRITPAHFISVLMTGPDEEDYQGMLIDASFNSIRIRLKEIPPFGAKSLVVVDFSFPEAGDSHRLIIKGTILRTAGRDVGYQIVIGFDPFEEKTHPYNLYIACRESEIVTGCKTCEFNGGKCKGEQIDGK